MMSRSISAVLIMLSVFMLFCQKDKGGMGSEESDPGIYGTVTDVNGVPLQDVGVHVIFLDYPFYRMGKLSKKSGANSVVLSYFEAQGGSGGVTLRWATSSESGNLGFEILRSNEQNGQYAVLASYETDTSLVGSIDCDSTRKYHYTDSNVSGGNQYWYKLIDVDTSGIETEHGPISITIMGGALPTEYRLHQNYPNPFNPSTIIAFQLPQESLTQISVLKWHDHDTVRTLIDNHVNAGFHQLIWDGKNNNGEYVTNNLYICRMEADSFEEQKTMCLLMLDAQHIRSLDAIPLANTNNEGKFVLNYSSIPFGENTVHTDELGNEIGILTVSQNIKIVLIKDGYQDFVEEIDVDVNSHISRTFRLTPQ